MSTVQILSAPHKGLQDWTKASAGNVAIVTPPSLFLRVLIFVFTPGSLRACCLSTWAFKSIPFSGLVLIFRRLPSNLSGSSLTELSLLFHSTMGWMFLILPEAICWSPNPKGDGIWKWVFGRWLACNEIVRLRPHNAISAFIRGCRDRAFPSMWRHSKVVAVANQTSPHRELSPAGTLISDV